MPKLRMNCWRCVKQLFQHWNQAEAMWAWPPVWTLTIPQKQNQVYLVRISLFAIFCIAVYSCDILPKQGFVIVLKEFFFANEIKDIPSDAKKTCHNIDIVILTISWIFANSYFILQICYAKTFKWGILSTYPYKNLIQRYSSKYWKTSFKIWIL